MQRRRPCFRILRTRILRTSAILGLAVAIIPIPLRAANDLEQQLRNQYNDKIVVLRGFYHGARLRYYSAGSPGGSAVSGDWTVDGFIRVTSLGLSGRRLTINGERLRLINGGQGFQALTANGIRIEGAMDPGGITPERVNAALSKIFLTPQDHLAELVPAYWGPCVLAASTGRGAKSYGACRFPPEFSAIPGVVYQSEKDTEPEGSASLKFDLHGGIVSGPRNGITPPKVFSQNNPEFSEEARAANYQGTVTLLVVVDETGAARNIWIVRPAGYGLDRNAVETVAKWRFKPALRDGEPVAFEAPVEVGFRLR